MDHPKARRSAPVTVDQFPEQMPNGVHARPHTGKLCLLVLAILTLAGLAYLHIPAAHFSFSETRRCELAFDQLYPSACLLSYYENERRVGTTKLHADLFDNPDAFFPGPDGHSAICFTYLDTTYATFTVDFAKRNQDEDFHNLRLRVPVEPIVDRSDFEVRACTAREVAYLEQYIKTADETTLAALVRGRSTPEVRKALLDHLTWSTRPYNSRDPVLRYAKPQLLPQN